MIGNLGELVKRTVRKAMAETRSSMPARIVSYDAGTRLASIQVLQPEVTDDDQVVEQPVITDVPVFMPIGGGAAVTFPVGGGDDGVVWFADQDIGAWVAGGQQSADSPRRHSLSDAMFMPAQGRGQADADNLVISFGGATITIQPSGNVEIDSPADVTITAGGSLTMNATSGGAFMSGDFAVNGSITTTGEVTASGVDLSTHTHNGGPPPDGSGGTGGGR